MFGCKILSSGNRVDLRSCSVQIEPKTNVGVAVCRESVSGKIKIGSDNHYSRIGDVSFA